jgi:site-specific recombinase XerD
VLAIPQKRFDKTIVSFLEPDEVNAVLAAPNLTRWEGRHDRALLVLAVQTGLRLSELTGITCGDIELGTGAHVRCRGKGRKQCCVSLTPPPPRSCVSGSGNDAGSATNPPRR